MKSVLISIRPNWCDLIASGEKTIEVRKTRPKIETPFRCYIYETKSRDNEIYKRYKVDDIKCGQVIGEFVCDCITPLYNVCTYDWRLLHGGLHKIEKQLVGMACLTEGELHEYASGRYCFAWHISDLEIYDKPKELSEFCRHDNTYDNAFGWAFENRAKSAPLTRPPQSWCYVEELE